MKKVWLSCALIVSCSFLVGMGGFGGPARVRAPEPSKNYSATIIDQDDIATDVEKISFSGDTAISGNVGSGQVSIDFGKIKGITFRLSDKVLEATVILKDGKTVSMALESGLACYAKLPYGEYKVDVKDIRSIIINGLVGKD